MEKNLKKLRTIGIVMVIILLSLIAFVGIYTKEANIWKNIIPNFKYGMELGGNREIMYTLDTTSQEKKVYIDSEGNILGFAKEEEEEQEEISLNATVKNEVAVEESEKNNYATEMREIKTNPDENITLENYEKVKELIKKRINSNKNIEYNIRQDTITGNIVIEVPNDEEKVTLVRQAVETIGKFEILEDETGIVLANNSDMKSFKLVAGSTENGYQPYLVINFTKSGAKKLKDISKKYIETTNEAGESNIKYVAITLDDTTITKTYFGEEMATGVLQIPLGNPTTDPNQYSNIMKELTGLVSNLNTGRLPLSYVLASDNYIQSSITNNCINIAKIVFLVMIVAVSVYFILKRKLQGVLESVLGIGFIAIYVLIVKYTDVIVTINSIVAFLAVVAMNYIFLYKLGAKKTDNENFKNLLKEFYISIIPICIIAVIFTLVGNIVISAIGMMLFWGIVVGLLYNISFTKALLITK